MVAPASIRGFLAAKRRQGIGILAPQEHGQAFEQHPTAHRDDDETDGGGFPGRTNSQAFEGQTQDGDCCYGQNKGQG